MYLLKATEIALIGYKSRVFVQYNVISLRRGVSLLCKLLVFAFTVMVPIMAQADTLQPFVSDGCSSFPDGTTEKKELWLGCCQKHDYDYWKGGTYQQRQTADQALESCVATLGEPKTAMLMLAGVRVGGTPFLPASFRWGYGWPYPRLYGQLTPQELEQIKKLTRIQSEIK